MIENGNDLLCRTAFGNEPTTTGVGIMAPAMFEKMQRRAGPSFDPTKVTFGIDRDELKDGGGSIWTMWGRYAPAESMETSG